MSNTRTYATIVTTRSAWYGTVTATSKAEATKLAQLHFDEGLLKECGEETDTVQVFRQRQRIGSWSTFERRFRPRQGPDGAQYWRREQLPANVDPHLVWTILDCDGRLFVSPGFRFVNRLEYVLCDVAWTEEDQHQPDYRYD